MDEKLKIFWNLDVLVKMCRSKSDGPSLRVEEEEILEKINAAEQEIEDIKASLEEETYDTSAEMADRNIEIITKKQLQSLKAELKEKNKELNRLKDLENESYNATSLLRENKASNEKYITSMQERLSENTDREVLDRYNALITETLTKVNELSEELKEENSSYEDIQNSILQTSADIEDLEARIDKKKKLLAETQTNLEDKNNYIDKTKKEKNQKRIVDINKKIEDLQIRLEMIRKDPKYIETKIKDVLNSKEDVQNARDYISELVKIVIEQPYINVPVDNSLEEELLRATQARDSFANEIDQKSYNILEANTPEKIRTEFLNKRIEEWNKELQELYTKISEVDKDSQYNYEENDRIIQEMIKSLKNDLKEFERAYNETPENNIGVKASLEVALEEKKEDIVEAEKIANAFKTNEAEDIANATRTIKYQCEQLNNNIREAEEEIKRIRNRLMSRKSGLIDIASRNKDKDVLRDLAQTVIDLKHRRQFPDTPLDIVKRLEDDLDIKILDSEDMEVIERTSVIEPKNYDEFISKKYEIPEETEALDAEESPVAQEVQDPGAVEVMNPEELLDSTPEDNLQKLADQAMANEPAEAPVEEIPAEEPVVQEETSVEEAPVEEPKKEEPVQEEQPTETSAEETPVEETPAEETPVEETPAEEPVKEETQPEEPEKTEEPAPEVTPTEEAPVEEPKEESVVETPVEEPAPQETATTEEVPAQEEQPVEQNMTAPAAADPNAEVQDNPFGEAINPLENEQPTEEPAPQEETIELSSAPVDDLSISSMFSNEVNVSEGTDNEAVRNNLSNELDNYINNIEEEQ